MLHLKLQQHAPVVVTITDDVVTQYSWSDCVISAHSSFKITHDEELICLIYLNSL